jgi:hypothetical protein
MEHKVENIGPFRGNGLQTFMGELKVQWADGLIAAPHGHPKRRCKPV